MKPLVSVIIPVYNGANYLREAIESVIKQSYKQIEIIVVNDGSTDKGETERIALLFGDKIRYYKKENGGVATALNLGIKKMQGEYFMWLSHDDIFYPDKIRYQVEMVLKEKVLLSICSYEIFTDSGRNVQIPMMDFYDAQFIERTVFPVLNAIIEFGGVILHRSIFDKYGVFREDLKTTQDYEFLFRILRRERCVYSNGCLYGVRSHVDQGRNTIVSVKSDIDELYCIYMKELTLAEKTYLYGSEYNFYYQMFLKIFPVSAMKKSKNVCLEGLANSEEPEKCFNLEKQEKGKEYIYGAGNYGQRLLFDLRCRGREAAGFIDGNKELKGKQIDGIYCYHLEDIQKDDCLIIVASVYRKEIAMELDRQGFASYIFKEDIDKRYMTIPPMKQVVLDNIAMYKESGWK